MVDSSGWIQCLECGKDVHHGCSIPAYCDKCEYWLNRIDNLRRGIKNISNIIDNEWDTERIQLKINELLESDDKLRRRR